MIRAALLAAAAILAWAVLRRWAQTPGPARPFSYYDLQAYADALYDYDPTTVTVPNQQTVTYTARKN